MSRYKSESNGLSSATELARPVNIPPRPALLMALQHEIAKKDPYIKKIARLVGRDVAVAGNLLSIANSAMFNLRQHVETVEDAITLIGLNHCGALMTNLMTRRALAHGKMMMPRFWDVSEKRSWSMMHVSKKIKIAPPELAHNFGLFSDIGIPLMMASFPSYLETLAIANRMETSGFLQLENSRHRINHAVVGAMLAEHWNIDKDVALAIKNHHTHEILKDDTASATAQGLVAIHFVVEKAIQEYRNAVSVEWLAGGALVSEKLGLSASDVNDICEELKYLFLMPKQA